jgi:hypothetical protein
MTVVIGGYQMSAIRQRLSDVSLNLSDYGEEHSPDLLNLRCDPLKIRAVPVAEPDCDQYVCFELAARSIGNAKKTNELLRCVTPTPSAILLGMDKADRRSSPDNP